MEELRREAEREHERGTVLEQQVGEGQRNFERVLMQKDTLLKELLHQCNCYKTSLTHTQQKQEQLSQEILQCHSKVCFSLKFNLFINVLSSCASWYFVHASME